MRMPKRFRKSTRQKYISLMLVMCLRRSLSRAVSWPSFHCCPGSWPFYPLLYIHNKIADGPRAFSCGHPNRMKWRWQHTTNDLPAAFGIWQDSFCKTGSGVYAATNTPTLIFAVQNFFRTSRRCSSTVPGAQEESEAIMVCLLVTADKFFVQKFYVVVFVSILTRLPEKLCMAWPQFWAVE